MGHDSGHAGKRSFHGPKAWVVSILVGLGAGALVGTIAPGRAADDGGHAGAHAGGGVVVYEYGPGSDAGRVIHGSEGGATAHEADGERGLGRPAAAITSGEEHDGPPPSALPAHAEPAEGAQPEAAGHAAPVVPIWLLIPFAVMLLSIAVMPFINMHVWEHHFPDFAFVLGSFMLSYYLTGFSEGGHGRHVMTHTVMEYFAFIALIGSLYVASGGILVDVRRSGSPAVNTAILALGAVMANIVGTTGASVLLIRPFMRINKGRLKPIHVIFFIFIVSNCGGCLTPIGDPPLYLGYLKGVPFGWTLSHLWPMWAAAVGVLLVMFFLCDLWIGRGGAGGEAAFVPATSGPPVAVRGVSAMIALAVIVGAVFIDPMLGTHGVGPIVQVLTAVVAYKVADPEIHKSNAFSFFPVKEVGLLFVGIFLTMAPALEYLAANGSKLGIESPSQFYFATGALSAALDNAPTYLNFLQTSFGVLHLPMNPENVHRFIENSYRVVHPDTGAEVRMAGQTVLEAISLGAVFFGAMTYIGNGPNFMVKSIAEASGLKMPSFFGYLLHALVLLLPVLILVWAVFLR